MYVVADISAENVSNKSQSVIVVGASAHADVVYPVVEFVNQIVCHIEQFVIHIDPNASTFPSYKRVIASISRLLKVIFTPVEFNSRTHHMRYHPFILQPTGHCEYHV